MNLYYLVHISVLHAPNQALLLSDYVEIPQDWSKRKNRSIFFYINHSTFVTRQLSVSLRCYDFAKAHNFSLKPAIVP